MKSKRAIFATGACVCALAASWLASTPAAAQEAAQAETPRVEETIIVTALRREQTLLESPAAITALSGETLSALNITAPSTVLQLTPGGNFIDSGDGRGQVFQLRGVGNAQGGAIGEPGVAVYIDDVYASGIRQNYPQQFDIARMEVLRGPQGGLYGRNAIGGAINITTAAADPTEFAAEGRLSAASFDRLDLFAVANLPLAKDVAAARFALWRLDQGEGEHFNPVRRTWLDSFTTTGGRLSLGGDLSETRRWSIVAEASDTDGPGSLLFSPGRETRKTMRRNAEDRADTQNFRITPKLVFDTALGEATLVYGYRRYEQSLSADGDFSDLVAPGTTADVRTPGNKEELSTHYAEARVAKDDGGRLRYVLGVNFYRETFESASAVRIVDTGPASPFGCAIAQFNPAANTFAFIPLALAFPGFPALPNCADANSARNKQTTEAIAAYADLGFDLTPTFDVNLGVRVTQEDKPFAFRQTSGPILGLFLPSANVNGDSQETNVSPSASARWRPNDRVMVYGRVNTGFRGGGFNTSLLSGGQLPYGQEQFVNFELGGRWSSESGRLVAGVTGFQLDQDDLVVSTIAFNPVTRAPSGVFLANAGEARTRGLELDLQGRLADNLTILGGISLLDAEFTGGSNAGTPLKGVALPSVPETSGALSLIYAPRWGQVSGEFAVSYRFRRGGKDSIQFAQPLSEFDVIDASAGFGFDRVKLVVFVSNATDEVYNFGQGFGVNGVPLRYESAGRSGGVRLEVRY